jgi:putative transposase
MKYDPEKHHRRSIRLKDDYSQAGTYLITICTNNRECLFGDVVDGEMRLNDAGRMVHRISDELPIKYSGIETDEFVVMPNHFHGIVLICRNDCRGEVSSPSSVSSIPKLKQGGETPPLHRRTLGQIVAYFKYQSAKQINLVQNTPGYPLWQRNYYEHIIRNEEEMDRIREYIIDNPAKWAEGENNSIHCKGLIDQTQHSVSSRPAHNK